MSNDLRERLEAALTFLIECRPARHGLIAATDKHIATLREVLAHPERLLPPVEGSADHLARTPDPKERRRCKCEFSGGGFPSKMCHYHDSIQRQLDSLRSLQSEAPQEPVAQPGMVLVPKSTWALAEECLRAEGWINLADALLAAAPRSAGSDPK